MSDLAKAFAAGTALAPDDLAGYVFAGVSLGMPRWFERATWKTFAKAFVRDGDLVRGWNYRVEQDGEGAPVRVRQRRGAPWAFGHFVVRPRGVGVELDFAPERGPMAALRDEIVAMPDGRLIGRTLLAIAGRRVPTPSYFVLTRAAAVQHVVPSLTSRRHVAGG